MRQLDAMVAATMSSRLLAGDQEEPTSWGDVFARIERQWPEVPQMSFSQIGNLRELPGAAAQSSATSEFGCLSAVAARHLRASHLASISREVRQYGSASLAKME
jgi:hypothetical protein